MMLLFCWSNCILLAGVLFSGCKPGSSNAANDTMQADSGAVAAGVQTDAQFVLKNVMINAGYVLADGEQVRGVKMDAAAITKFKPQSIDEFYVMGDTYYVVDTISRSSAGSVYFILKYDPNETSGWLVIYDPQMKVMDQIEVYYENAEGNFYLTSSILDNIVTTAGENITPEENPVSAFRIVEGPRWQVIEH